MNNFDHLVGLMVIKYYPETRVRYFLERKYHLNGIGRVSKIRIENFKIDAIESQFAIHTEELLYLSRQDIVIVCGTI
ncbi:hypothetical protein MXB_3664 [Myxobolus squamalis]|nr:hypothetical protein MXB_3664 [Myxobolus squamalis]